MTDLIELEKKYVELGKEIKALKKGQHRRQRRILGFFA